ncbi:MAG: hypothetical protein ACRDFR_06995, partial [Candidatus Limnocylindria bacterium]
GGTAYAPAPAPTLAPRVVPAPQRPTSAEPIDGSGQLVHVATANIPIRAWADADSRGVPVQASTIASLRVESAGGAERGVFETFLGALIGFLFG